MRAHKATHTLAFLVVAALGVSGARAQTGQAQGKSTSKSPATAKHRPATQHGKTTKKISARERGQKEPTSDRISEIQAALGKDGSFAGTPSGKWDDSTVAAMKKFQETHGLNPSGKLDAKTLQKLGLGSQTAGLAPPMPPVSSSSLTTGPNPAPSVPPRQ